MSFRRFASKFGSKRVEVSGMSFASKLEAAVFQVLKLMEKAGEVKDIKAQDTVYLSKARIIYKPDFKIETTAGETAWVEAKGFETPEWRIKLRLWKAYGPGPLWIFRGSHANPKLDEVVKGGGDGDSNG
jgi:predicted nuclease of restriction endonuclease-like RecB superfamily